MQHTEESYCSLKNIGQAEVGSTMLSYKTMEML